jgi:hypothetical protein
MQILLKLFLLLINIDQETVLNFFGIEDPNIYLNTGFEGALVSTEISIETLKLIFQGLLEQYQYGLGLIDIENILLFITFLRFIILANRYNIKTSFYISCISLFAGFLWYIHLKDLVTWYGEMITYNRLTSRYIDDMMTEAYIEQSKSQSGMYLEFMNQNPLNFLKSSLVYASERDGYRIDPLSMVVSSLPQSMQLQVTTWYYYLYNNFLPGVWNVVGKQLQEIAPLLMYVLIVRINKKYCPYFIRWHWTYLVVSSLFEGEIIRIIYRLYVYDTTVLVPAGRFDESGLLQPFFMVIVTAHYFLICLGLLHATCGQYFYIPFLTENTEVHIGKRPQNSIYSGGYTSWQEGGSKQVQIMTKDRKFLMLPRLWWGWFGKKNNTNEVEYRKNQQNQFRKNRLKGLKKLIRKLRKLILNN